MKKRVVKGGQIASQDLYDVIEDFYRLGHDINGYWDEHASNYSIIRLVTIMEQFCRCAIEERLEKHAEQIPQKIEIDYKLLDDLLETMLSTADESIKNAVVSMSYSFQNVYTICEEMKNFGLLDKQNKIKDAIMELEPLFQMRHVLVHTVEPWPLGAASIASYHAKVEEVVREILDKMDMPMYDFYILKGHAFGEMVKRVCLRNMPCIENMHQLPSMIGAERDKGAVWVESAEKFHNISIECFNSALQRFGAKIEEEPSRHDILSEIAWTYVIRNDYYNAGKAADAVLESDPAEAVACYCKGMSLLDSSTSSAFEYFKKAIDGKIYVTESYTRAIEILLDIDKAEEALFYVDQVIDMEPSDPLLYMLKGRILSRLKLISYEKECYKIGDERSIEFMKDRRNDILTCAELTHELLEHNRTETIEKCFQVLKERFGHSYSFKQKQ